MKIVNYITGLFLVFLLVGCAAQQAAPAETVTPEAKALPYEGKKILHIDSYHYEFGWSKGITDTIKEKLEGTGVELKRYQMDTKRNTDEEFKKQAALEAKAIIEEFNPDVVIASDDNAFNFLIKEYYKDAALPFVYIGVNWDSSVYGAPYTNTAGMVEISLTKQIIDYLFEINPNKGGSKVGYISADAVTERKVMKYYEEMGIEFDKIYWAKDVADFEKLFAQLQEEVDVVFFENTGGLENYEADAPRLKAWMEENIKVPVGGTYTQTQDYCVFQLQKMPEEQGEYAVEIALKIIDGTSPAVIPEVTNKKGKLVINMGLAEKIGATIGPHILKNAEIINE